jgi:hypothetical protein
MASSAKHKVGGKVTYYRINLGDFVMNANLYFTILGSYEIVINMEWLESHDVILNYKTKWLSLTDDVGQRRVIVGRK